MESSMNLLFLTKLLPRKEIIGGPILIYHRIKNLSAMGHKITLVAPVYNDEDRNDTSLEPFCEKIIRVDSIGERPEEEVLGLRKKLNRPRFFLTGDGGYNEGIEDALRTAFNGNRFDAIIAEYSMMGQYIESGYDFVPARTMTVISVHECYTKAFQLRAEKGEDISEDIIRELFEYEFRMYRAADIVSTLTREDGDILINYDPSLKSKIRVVPHGVDTGFYTPPDEEHWNSNTKNLLYIGNFHHPPNVDAVRNFLDHCWDKVQREVPDAKFHVIGLNPPQEFLDLRSDNVIVREGGDNENVRRIYQVSDVFVAPIELGTGFRGKLLEAMACGLPIVATPLAAFGIDPKNEENMFVTDDYKVFSDYVCGLLKDPGLRKKISTNCLALAKEFDHARAAEKLERVLKEGKG